MTDVAAWEPHPTTANDDDFDVVVRLQLKLAGCVPVAAQCAEVARTHASVLVRMTAAQRVVAAGELDQLAVGTEPDVAAEAMRAHAAIDAAVRLELAARAEQSRRDARDGRARRVATRPVRWEDLDRWTAECQRAVAHHGAQIAVVDAAEGLHLVVGCSGEACCDAQPLTAGGLSGRCPHCGTAARPHVWDRVELAVQQRPGTRSAIVEAPTPAEVEHRCRKGKVLWEVRQTRRCSRAATSLATQFAQALDRPPDGPDATLTAAVRAGMADSNHDGANQWQTRVSFAEEPGALEVGWTDGAGQFVAARRFDAVRPADAALAVLGVDQVSAAANPDLSGDRLVWLWHKATGVTTVPEWLRDDSVAAALQLAAPATEGRGRGIEL